jgi:serine/threonine protein kinase
MEKCDYSLSQFITLYPNLKIPLKIDLALQMNQGLLYLHDKNLIHKDVKPNNFLLKIITEDKWIIKLADLGFSKRLMDSSSKITSKLDCDALTWVAPELFRPPYHFFSASDVWASGCVIYFLFSKGKHPFDSQDKKKLTREKMNLIMAKYYDQTELDHADIQQRLGTMIEDMIDNDHNNRPTMKEVTSQLMQLCNCQNPTLGLSGSNQPRRVGQIEYDDSKVLGEGNQSTIVFEGTFFSVGTFKKITTRPCAVKRIMKEKGGQEIDEINKKKIEEIKTLIELTKNGTTTTILHVIQCYGFEENNDFWYIIKLPFIFF